MLVADLCNIGAQVFLIPPVVLMRLQDEFATNRRKGVSRRVRIHRNIELPLYGFTDACVGCDAAAQGLKAVGHTEECRSRIEAKMLEDEAAAARLRRARERQRERRPMAPPPERPKRVSRAARAASASGQKRHRGVKRKRSSKECASSPRAS